MPSVPEHHSQAIHNAAFSQVFDQTLYADWAVTARFYAAAHLIRAWLSAKGVRDEDMESHHDVAGELRRWHLDRRIQIAYRDLSTLSRESRYECYPPQDFVADVQKAQSLYDEIKRYIDPWIARHLPPSP